VNRSSLRIVPLEDHVRAAGVFHRQLDARHPLPDVIPDANQPVVAGSHGDVDAGVDFRGSGRQVQFGRPGDVRRDVYPLQVQGKHRAALDAQAGSAGGRVVNAPLDLRVVLRGQNLLSDKDR
jgi:hypothetical protein